MLARFKGIVLRLDISKTKVHKLIFCSILLVSVLMLGLTSVLVYLQYYVRCSEIEGECHIRETCRLYHAKVFTGNMCSKLCDENLFRYSQCGGNRANKKVQILTCDGCIEKGIKSKVVLKSELRADLWDYMNTVQFSDHDSFKVKVLKTSNDITRRLKSRFQLDYSTHSNLLNFILGDDYVRVIRTLNTTNGGVNVLLNIISLATQREYLAMKVFGPSSYIPKLYGTCGSSYFVEHTPPFGNLNYVRFQGKVTEIIKSNNRLPSWTERARVGIQMLDLIRTLESDFDRPVHMCDANAGNFGVNCKGNVVLLDTGSVLFENTTRSRICERDSDCDHNSCLGACSVTTKVCRKEMRTNNLQTICRKVFITAVEKFGLLRNPPAKVSSELRDIVWKCAYPTKTVLRLPRESRSDMKMLKKVEILLKSSLT